MKTRFLKILLVVCFVVCCFSFVFCLTSCSNGNDAGSNLSFELVNGKEYQVTGLGEDVSTDIVIPDTYKGLPVTSIADGTFKCKYLTSVVIGSNVKTIGDEAFLGCYRMTSVTIPDSVTSIGKGAFVDCFALPYNEYENCKYLYTKSNPYHALIGIAGEECSSYTMHEDTVVVVGGAFDGCSNIENITISGKVKFIGSYTFNNCASLMSIVIPNNVESIGDYAFYNCHNISKAIIGNSVQSIGEYAFSRCYSLESLTIPDGVTSIGDYAFCQCTRLTIITVPSKVTSIGNRVFSNCNSLNAIKVDSENTVYSSIDKNLYTKDGKTLIQYAIGKAEKEFVIPEGVTSIGIGAFAYCTNLNSVEIPEGVIDIGASAFYECTGLLSVSIAETVTSIGSNAFLNCSGLTSLVIPESVTSIGEVAFAGCSSLTSVVIPNSVNKTGYNLFGNYSNITRVFFKGTLEEWEKLQMSEKSGSGISKATIYYYIESEVDVPNDGGNYWHYDEDGNPTIW